MQEIKPFKRNFWKSKELTKTLSTYRKETHMTYSVKRDSNKFNKDQNQREVILELTWAFLFQPFTQVDRLSIVSKGAKFVNTAKAREIQQAPYILVLFVVDLEKWLEKSKLKMVSKTFKWNVRNAMEADMLENKNVLFVMVRKSLWNQETCILKLKKGWEQVIKFFSRVNHNKDSNFTPAMFTWHFISNLTAYSRDKRTICW